MLVSWLDVPHSMSSGITNIVIARLNLEDHFKVPFSLVELSATTLFVGRKDELTAIHTTLSQSIGRTMAVVHGLGGMGKTQLAVAYAKRHQSTYSAIFWLNIRDEDSLKQSFSAMVRRVRRAHPSASRLGLLTHETRLDEITDVVTAWLSRPQNRAWLIIFDNYDTLKIAGHDDAGRVDIRRFLPEADHGVILVTTRSSRVDIGHQIRLKKLMYVKECIQILSERTQWDSAIQGRSVMSDTSCQLRRIRAGCTSAGQEAGWPSLGFGDCTRVSQRDVDYVWRLSATL